MKRILTIALCLITSLCGLAQSLEVTVTNPMKGQRNDVPVVINIQKHHARSATVTLGTKEIPCQLDDLNGDGIFDELCFLADFSDKGKQIYKVALSSRGEMRNYPARVYAEMLLNHPKQKNQRQTNYISSLTTEGNADIYNCLQHHGPAFESELAAYRIYFDKRQTVDIYAKYHKGLELHQTQFYPTREELNEGFGDDCLWVGSTLGLGTLRGWNGEKPTFLDDVKSRTERIIAYGPLRTIVEVVDEKWNTGNVGRNEVNMTTRYTLYGGHRDVQVDITLQDAQCSPAEDGYTLCTGIINVKNSTEYTDDKGLRGCWGTDWPVSEKDSIGHKRETVGLGICIPPKYLLKQLPKDKDNYAMLVTPQNGELHYNICFASDNEDFGYHSDKAFYAFLKEWRKGLDNPVKITIGN